MPLANILFPANARLFLYLLKDIVTFDILPTDFIEENLFEFSDSMSDSIFFEFDIF